MRIVKGCTTPVPACNVESVEGTNRSCSLVMFEFVSS